MSVSFIRVNCMAVMQPSTISSDEDVCLSNPPEHGNDFVDSDLILEPVLLLHVHGDHSMEMALLDNMRLLYHWSEINFESLASRESDVEEWHNLIWSKPIMRVPSPLISRLSSASVSSSSLPTLQFRVWVRLVVVADDSVDNPWLESRPLASAYNSVDVTVGAAPSSGSCAFVPKGSPPNSIFALETPVRVQCLNWTDPILAVLLPVDSDITKSYSTSLQLHRAPIHRCIADTNKAPKMNETDDNDVAIKSFIDYEEVVVPQHRFVSQHEAEAVLPSGCWMVLAVAQSKHSGLSTLTLLTTGALYVDLPSERRLFSSDESFYKFA